jgi:hypothetical protein
MGIVLGVFEWRVVELKPMVGVIREASTVTADDVIVLEASRSARFAPGYSGRWRYMTSWLFTPADDDILVRSRSFEKRPLRSEMFRGPNPEWSETSRRSRRSEPRGGVDSGFEPRVVGNVPRGGADPGFGREPDPEVGFEPRAVGSVPGANPEAERSRVSIGNVRGPNPEVGRLGVRTQAVTVSNVSS